MSYDVSIEPLPPMAVFSIQADEVGAQEVAERMGYPLPERNAVVNADRTLVALSAREWLLIADRGEEAEIKRELLATAFHGTAAIVLLSDAYSGFCIDGNDALQVMSQVVAIELHTAKTNHAWRCGFGKASAVVVCRAPDRRFDVFVDRTLATYGQELLRVCAA